MTLFQVAAALFAICMLYVVTVHYKKKTLTPMETSFWVSLWIGFISIALFPDLLKEIVQTLNFTRVFDLLIVIALMILTTLVFGNYFSYKASQRKLESFIRDLAIQEGSENHTESKK